MPWRCCAASRGPSGRAASRPARRSRHPPPAPTMPRSGWRSSPRSGASIRTIPITSAALLLLTLYGPLGLTGVSISSQGRRLARMLQASDTARIDAREASAALRFLMDHNAGAVIAARIGRDLPPIEWAVPVASSDARARMLGADTVSVVPLASSGLARIRVGTDTLEFDLRQIARRHADSLRPRASIPAERLRIEAAANGRRGALALTNLSGRLRQDSIEVGYWSGSAGR
jgi:hypothetical protein